jgi:hypothetical protein
MCLGDYSHPAGVIWCGCPYDLASGVEYTGPRAGPVKRQLASLLERVVDETCARQRATALSRPLSPLS